MSWTRSLRHHLEALEGEYLSRGLSVDEARRAARRDMGGIAQVREAHRDQRSIPALEILWRNIRFGLRSLRRTPGVTTAVLATLAIGIGANTAIFTIVYDVLLKPLPYPDAEQLVGVRHRSGAAAEEIPSAPATSTLRIATRAARWRTSGCGVLVSDGDGARSPGAGAGAARHARDPAYPGCSAAGRSGVFGAGRYTREHADNRAGLRLLATALRWGCVGHRADGDRRRPATRDRRRPAAALSIPRSADRRRVPVSTRSEQRDARALRLPEPGAPEARRATGGRVNGSRADRADRHRPIPPAGRLHARAVRSTADDAARPAAERRGGR